MKSKIIQVAAHCSYSSFCKFSASKRMTRDSMQLSALKQIECQLLKRTSNQKEMKDSQNTTGQIAKLPILLLISDRRLLSLVESFGTLLAKHLPTRLVDLKYRGSIIPRQRSATRQTPGIIHQVNNSRKLVLAATFEVLLGHDGSRKVRLT